MQPHLVEVRGKTRPDRCDTPIEHRTLQTAPDLSGLHPQPEDPGDAPLYDAFQCALESCQHDQASPPRRLSATAAYGRVKRTQSRSYPMVAPLSSDQAVNTSRANGK